MYENRGLMNRNANYLGNNYILLLYVLVLKTVLNKLIVFGQICWETTYVHTYIDIYTHLYEETRILLE